MPHYIEREQWRLEDAGRGRLTIRLASFAHFDALVRALAILPDMFVWRGHADPTWTLKSSLDRLREDSGFAVSDKLTARHLARFKRATRGRISPMATPSDENAWWALGQHYGLATPLLDWTSSPWAAAYFAFHGAQSSPSASRCIWGLSRYWAAAISGTIASEYKGEGRPPIIDFVDPFTHDNARLIAQDGVFSRTPDGVTVEDWVSAHTKPTERFVHLLRIELPSAERSGALEHLKAMRVSHQTLFPDVFGAAVTTNHDYESIGDTISLYHKEHLIELPKRDTRTPSDSAEQRVDPVRSTLRSDKPLYTPGDKIHYTLVARDKDGAPVEGAKVEFKVQSVGPLANPFYATDEVGGGTG